MPSEEAARGFGYSPGTFRVLCSRFRHDPHAREFFQVTSVGRPPGVRRHDPVRQIFRDLIDLPATVKVTPAEVRVTLHRRAHLPILLASNLFAENPQVPWWNGARLALQANHDR